MYSLKELILLDETFDWDTSIYELRTDPCVEVSEEGFKGIVRVEAVLSLKGSDIVVDSPYVHCAVPVSSNTDDEIKTYSGPFLHQNGFMSKEGLFSLGGGRFKFQLNLPLYLYNKSLPVKDQHRGMKELYDLQGDTPFFFAFYVKDLETGNINIDTRSLTLVIFRPKYLRFGDAYKRHPMMDALFRVFSSHIGSENFGYNLTLDDPISVNGLLFGADFVFHSASYHLKTRETVLTLLKMRDNNMVEMENKVFDADNPPILSPYRTYIPLIIDTFSEGQYDQDAYLLGYYDKDTYSFHICEKTWEKRSSEIMSVYFNKKKESIYPLNEPGFEDFGDYACRYIERHIMERCNRLAVKSLK